MSKAAEHDDMSYGDRAALHRAIASRHIDYRDRKGQPDDEVTKQYKGLHDKAANLNLALADHYATMSQWRGPKKAKASFIANMLTLLANEYMKNHRVRVSVSEPKHPYVSKRDELVEKHWKGTARDSGHAMTKAKSYYQKRGFKVHDLDYIGQGD